jgi:hypothetical protein
MEKPDVRSVWGQQRWGASRLMDAVQGAEMSANARPDSVETPQWAVPAAKRQTYGRISIGVLSGTMLSVIGQEAMDSCRQGTTDWPEVRI